MTRREVSIAVSGSVGNLQARKATIQFEGDRPPDSVTSADGTEFVRTGHPGMPTYVPKAWMLPIWHLRSIECVYPADWVQGAEPEDDEL